MLSFIVMKIEFNIKKVTYPFLNSYFYDSITFVAMSYVEILIFLTFYQDIQINF